MSTSLPLDPQDLDLVAAFAAGELDGANMGVAEELIASDPRFADEFAAQLEAIAAVGNDDWYQPLSDFERLSLRKAVVPEKQRPSWAARALAPLSVAAVLVVVVGFVGMQLNGGSSDATMESSEIATTADAAVIESSDTRLSDEESAQTADGSTSEDAADTAIESLPAPINGALVPAPEEGALEGVDLGEIESLDDLLDFSQWVIPVSLSRYSSLDCWVDEDDLMTSGIATATLNGVEYEVLTDLFKVEVRAVDSCEAIILDK
jgi:hypothetical protein